MRFSVIVPAHNSAAFIEKGLQSIKEQDFKDYELIVICDACEDNTVEVTRKYAEVVKITDFGRPGLARNVGIEAAQGEYIIFMDSDDWFLHEYVFTQLDEKLKEESPDILAFSFIFKHWMYAIPRGLKGDYWPAVWNKCWKTSFLKPMRFSADMVGEDALFQANAMSRQPKVVDWDMPLYYYNYLRTGSISETRRR